VPPKPAHNFPILLNNPVHNNPTKLLSKILHLGEAIRQEEGNEAQGKRKENSSLVLTETPE
jgi:hypothetical protein